MTSEAMRKALEALKRQEDLLKTFESPAGKIAEALQNDAASMAMGRHVEELERARGILPDSLSVLADNGGLGGNRLAIERALAENAARLSTLTGGVERSAILQAEAFMRELMASGLGDRLARSAAVDAAALWSADAARMNEVARTALGPLEDIGRLGLNSATARMAMDASSALSKLTERYSLPGPREIDDVVRGMQMPASALTPADQTAVVRAAMTAMHDPWLDRQEAIRSASAFASLQALGQDLNKLAAFDATLCESMRARLGDWRKPVVLPENIDIDLVARSEFYVGRGFDPSLTAFPPRAFREALVLAGLTVPPPRRRDDTPAERVKDDEDEAGFARTNAAHKVLMALENLMRRFLDEAMRAARGDTWIKHYVPGEVRMQWERKKQQDLDDGRPDRPLIAYADFTDYITIISRKDNWEDVFQGVFRRQEDVRESFQRLYPIRKAMAHARPISQDDELLLHAEARRLKMFIEMSRK